MTFICSVLLLSLLNFTSNILTFDLLHPRPFLYREWLTLSLSIYTVRLSIAFQRFQTRYACRFSVLSRTVSKRALCVITLFIWPRLFKIWMVLCTGSIWETSCVGIYPEALSAFLTTGDRTSTFLEKVIILIKACNAVL